MEQARWDTPDKVRKCDSPLINNLWMHRTPSKQHKAGLKQTLCQSNTPRLPFSILPSHITPPSKLRRFIKNPFEPDLTNRLHQSVISPTVFTKVSNNLQGSPGFTWNIEELARLQPVKIEESPIQQSDFLDQELETKAQAAIDRFFKQNNQIIPSPWDVKQQKNKPCISLDTPNRPLCDLNSTKEVLKLKKDVWCQTVLSLPLNLPQNVEEALKPFYIFTQEQNIDNDDANLSNNSLRRKLFFNHDERIDNESVASLSPVKMSESMMLSCSPPQSGMFVHGRLKMLQSRRHSDELSIAKSELSPPNISPIYNAENNMLHEKVGHSSHLATSLDFTMDISMDNISLEKNQIPINNCEKLSDSESDKKCIEEDHKLINHKTNLNESVNMVELPRHLNTAVDNTVFSDDVIFSDKDNGASLKMMTEMQSLAQGSHKQSNIMSGAFTQQSISNIVQDTGYQTYSMNNTIHMVDSYSDTSVSHKTHWNERVVTSKDNVQLSWKENMSNVFSSTPSKYNKENGS